MAASAVVTATGGPHLPGNAPAKAAGSKHMAGRVSSSKGSGPSSKAHDPKARALGAAIAGAARAGVAIAHQAEEAQHHPRLEGPVARFGSGAAAVRMRG